MTDDDTETIDADAVRDLTPDEVITPVGPDNPVELEPGPDNPLLAAQGFGLTRERLTSAARDIATVPVELLDATIAYAEGALAKARIAGAQVAHLDAIESDVLVLKATRRLRLELKNIGEKMAARQAIRG